MPSYAMAQQELDQRGVQLDIKVVHGIAVQAGTATLAFRTRELHKYRAGQMPVGTEFAGKRLAAFVDGGRTRLRRVTRKQRGLGKHKTQKRRYKAEWREPKLLIIYEIDEQGRMKAGTRPFIDGTIGGPDALMELLAMRLHQLGPARLGDPACRTVCQAGGEDVGLVPWRAPHQPGVGTPDRGHGRTATGV